MYVLEKNDYFSWKRIEVYLDAMIYNIRWMYVTLPEKNIT